MSGLGWNDYNLPPRPRAGNQASAVEPDRVTTKPTRRRFSFKTRLLVVAALVALASAAGVFAYWTTHGSGTATASVATLNGPTAVNVPATSSGTVHVTWTASSTGGGGVTPQGYYVESNTGGPGWALACSSSPSSLISGTSCDDTEPSGFYTYRVTAVFNSWTGQSSPSGSVHVISDSTPPAVYVTKVNGNTVTFPFSTNQNITSIGGTCGTDVGDLTPVSWSIDSQSGTATCTSGTWTSGALTTISTEGSYPAGASQSDNASNTGSDSELIRLDKTDPLVAITTINGNAASFPYSLNVNVTSVGGTCGVLTGDSTTINVTIIGTASQAGVATCSSETWTYSASPALSANGSYTVTATQSDLAGNSGSSGGKSITIDRTAPTVTLTAPTNNSFSNNTTPTFSGACTTGDGNVTIVVKQGSTTSQTRSAACTSGAYTVAASPALTGNTYTAQASQTDAASNTGSSSTNTFTVDTTAPITTITINPSSPNGTNGWYTGTLPTFILSATDTGGSGVATTKYQIDSGTITTYTTAVTIAQGQHTISYWSTDNATNLENTHTSGTIKVDTTAPVTTLTTTPGSPDGANNWFKQSSVTFTLGVTETGSGVASTKYTIDGGSQQTYTGVVTINTQGDHTITYWSTDNAGNIEAANTSHIKLDNIGPNLGLTLTASPVGASFTGPGTLTYKANAIGSFQFAATVTDGTSGAASATYPAIGTAGWNHNNQTVTGSSPYTSTTFSWSANPTNPSGYTITATDQAGNTTTQAITFVVDNTAPTLSSLQMFDTNDNGKVDEVVATFNETLNSCTAPCTTGWTLANVPSGGTLSSVTVSGSAATLNINEGAGAANTAVGSFTVALANTSGIADAAGNHSSFVAQSPADKAAPVLLTLQMFDTNTDGKVNQVKATFSETLASSTAIAPWTFANIPSGGTLASVSTATTTATLTITEGVGGADTSVGSFTIALATNAAGIRDAASNLSSFASTAPADKAAPVPLVIDSANAGATTGMAEGGDTVTITFSEALATIGSTSQTVTLDTSNGSSKAVTLTIPGLTSAAFQIGKKNDYLTGNSGTGAQFTNSTLSQPAPDQVKITLGTWDGNGALSVGVFNAGNVGSFTPAATLTDAAGNSAAGSVAVTIRFF